MNTCLRLTGLLLWLLIPAVAFADLAPPGPQDYCGCSLLGVLPIPAGALLIAMAAMRRDATGE